MIRENREIFSPRKFLAIRYVRHFCDVIECIDMTLENAQSLSSVDDYSSLSMYFFTSIGCCVCRKQATSPLSVQPTLSLDGITTLAFVPVITKHSELVLYGIPSTDDHKTHFPNAEAIMGMACKTTFCSAACSNNIIMSTRCTCTCDGVVINMWIQGYWFRSNQHDESHHCNLMFFMLCTQLAREPSL